MRSVSLFHHAASKFGVVGQMVQDLCAAFNRLGISAVVRHIDEKSLPDLLPVIQKDNPDCTWGVNTLVGENCFYYPLGVPHVSLSVDSVTYAQTASFSQPHLVSLFTDNASCDLFSKVSNNPVHWFPHAIAKEVVDGVRTAPVIPLSDRPFDVSLIGSYIDHEEERCFWESIFTPSDTRAFIDLAERVLDDPSFEFFAQTLAYIERTGSVQDVLKKIDLSPFSLANSCERYARGLDRERLLKALKNRKVHIFTNEKDAELWAKKEAATACQFHLAVPFREVVDVCRMSKVVIQSAPTIHTGYHERLFLSLVSGAVTLMNKGPKLPVWLTEKGRVVEYTSSKLDGVLDFLHGREECLYDVTKIAAWLEKEHSWEARLREHLPSIEKSVKEIHTLWEENPFWRVVSPATQ